MLNEKITIGVTITPVHALRTIEIQMPWYYEYRGCHKLWKFFYKNAKRKFHNRSRYAFPLCIRDEYNEYTIKEHFNNSKYRMKR